MIIQPLIGKWIKTYKNSGFKTLIQKKQGVTSEDKKLLSHPQELEIQKMITNTMTDQLKLSYELWTRNAVKELVEREFGIALAINIMGDYLRKLSRTNCRNQSNKND